MPIIVSDYIWHQTDHKILLSLDLRHTSPKNVDIVTTNSYLKVSYLPYIFEAFLCNMINADESSAKILNGRIEFDLLKEENTQWSNLCLKLTQEEMRIRRHEALKNIEHKEEKKLKEKRESHIQRDRFSVSQQIAEDERLREDRNKKKEEAKSQFIKDAFESSSLVKKEFSGSQNSVRSRFSSTCSEDGLVTAAEVDYDGDGEDSHYYSSTENLHKLDSRNKCEKIETSNRKQQRKCLSSRNINQKDEESKKKKSPVPPVRQNATIKITYTERVFTTPSRESRHEEEQEWLQSQSVLPSKSTDNVETHDVDYYKRKATSLFESGDYKGCINAYTEALRLNPKMASLFSNRAAANLALNNLHHTINDCTKALDLLTPPSAGNSKSRLLCHVRRGTAFARLGLYSEGILDYQAARKIDPSDKNILKDLQRIKGLMMTTSTDSGESDEDESDFESYG